MLDEQVFFYEKAREREKESQSINLIRKGMNSLLLTWGKHYKMNGCYSSLELNILD